MLHGTDIDVVPVQVIISGRAQDETADESGTRRVSEALRAWQPVTTSRPTPERFRQAFVAAAEAGATSVVCATLSARISGTHESAVLAAREVDIDVRVVDSRSVAMGLGFAVLAGERRAAAGADVEEVVDVVTRTSHHARCLFYVDTLEYLRRGGRIGAARAAMGQALQVKPILQVRDGEVVALERVRTSAKAIARLADLAVEAARGFRDGAVARDGAVEIAVQQLDAGPRASALAEQLHARLPGVAVVECPIGAVVAAHTGPGLVAVVVSPIVT